MYDLLEMLDLVNVLFHNVVFGILWFMLGIILFLSTKVIVSNNHCNRSGAKVVKAIGYTVATFFFLPGIMALVLSIRQVL